MITPSGGTQRFFSLPNGVCVPSSVGKIGDGLDVRASGGYTIGPPSFVKETDNYRYEGFYEWLEGQSPFDFHISESPRWLIDIASASSNTKFILKEKIPVGMRNDHLFKFAAKLRGNGLEYTEIFSALKSVNEARCSPRIPQRELEAIAKSSCRYARGTNIHWDTRRDKNNNEIRLITANNIENFLRTDPVLSGLIRFNTFFETLEFSRSNQINSSAKEGDYINDNDIILIRSYFSKNLHYNVSIKMIYECITSVAIQDNSYHPVINYLNSLKWDGVNRLDRWLVDYAGAQNYEYTHEVSSKTLIAAVKRIFEPGCKVDTMLILEGSQGLKKSQLIEMIGKEWYADVMFTHDKDMVQAIKHAWIVEISELNGIGRREIDEVKAFLSRNTDLVRMPYDRLSRRYPRHNIFFGTINPDGDNSYLRDATGNRRFWPVEVSYIDLKGLSENVDNLWAEAVVRYKAGEKVYLTNEITINQAFTKQEERMEVDPWMDIIEGYLMKNSFNQVSLAEIAENALDLSKERMEDRFIKRIARALKKLGGQRIQVKRRWVYDFSLKFEDLVQK
jgi:predicted P-loop ATPase